MHPNRAFAWEDREDVLRFIAERSFAHIFTATGEKLFVVHVPVLVTAEGRIRFHVAIRNRIAEHLSDRPILLSISGREAYQSANWYVSENQVPTWHYEAVEIEGLHSPERPWTRAKMGEGKFEAMIRAIVGFEIDPIEIRGTRKFNQHKSAGDLAATIAGQEGADRKDIVQAIE